MSVSKPLHSNTVIHQVSESCHWPPEISQIVFPLSQATPIPNVDPGSLSPFARQIYDEAMAQLPPASMLKTQNTSRNLVDDIIDTVFTTVSALRLHAATEPDKLPPQPMLPILGPLFNVLGLACSSDSVTMMNVPFLLPRTVVVDDIENINFDGHAKCIISSYIAPKCVQFDEIDTGTSDSGYLGSGISAGAFPQASFAPFDGPFDGHILPGSGKRVDCIFPVICVADAENISSLVISTVYQRYAWGVSLPVVGVSVGNTGLTATIVIGWIDKEEQIDDPELPTVHLASSFGGATNASLGIFDLLDPRSTLHFTQFVLSLRGQFKDIILELHPPQREICWRLDHKCKSSSRNPHTSVTLDRQTRITQWLEGMDDWDRDPLEPLEVSDIPPPWLSICDPNTFPSCSSSKNSGNDGAEYEADDSESECSTESSSTMYRDECERFAALKDSIVPPVRFGKSGRQTTSLTSSMPSHYSASTFAVLEDTLTDEKHGMEHWLWDRRTLRLGRLRMKGVTLESLLQINAMIDHYAHTFELTWPSKWPIVDHCIDEVPCDPIYRDLLNLLFDQHKAYSSSSMVPVPTLAEDEFTFFKNRLSLFLSAVSTARRCIQQTAGELRDQEMKIRESVNLLLNLFWCEDDSIISNSYFPEHNIQLAESKAAQVSLDEIPQIHLWEAIAFHQYHSLEKGGPPALKSLALKALKQSGEKSLYNMDYPQTRQPDNSVDPRNMIADGLAVTRASVEQSSFGEDGLQIKTANTKYLQSVGGYILDEPTSSARMLQHRLHLKDPFVTTLEHHSLRQEFLPSADFVALSPQSELLESTSQFNEAVLPRIILKYQRANSRNPASAFRQCQMCCISSVELLASIRIRDFPIYGMVVSGSRVTIMMAWHSSKSMMLYPDQTSEAEFNVLIDENVLSLDVSEPLDAYRFAVAIRRIFLAGKQLSGLLEGKDSSIRTVQSDVLTRRVAPN